LYYYYFVNVILKPLTVKEQFSYKPQILKHFAILVVLHKADS